MVPLTTPTLINAPSDFLGCAKLSLKELRDESGTDGPWTRQILLEDVPKGELELRLNYKPLFGSRSKVHH